MRRTVAGVGFAVFLLGGCQGEDPVSVACRDLASQAADAAMSHGAAVRESRRVEAAYARLNTLENRYATEGCPKDYLRYVIRHVGLDETLEGTPATYQPPNISPVSPKPN